MVRPARTGGLPPRAPSVGNGGQLGYRIPVRKEYVLRHWCWVFMIGTLQERFRLRWMQGTLDARVPDSLRHSVQCPNCGLTQTAEASCRRDLTSCSRCATQLEHCAGKSLDVTLACSVGILVLLIPAFVAPFLTTYALGTSLTSTLPMSASVLWQNGHALLSLTVGLFVLILPLVRFTALSLVLAALRADARPAWLAPMFRMCNALQTWAMLDVFLLGLMVAYIRLRASLVVSLGPGGMCFIAAAVLSLVARATLDRAQVWRMIAPDRVAGGKGCYIACPACEEVLPIADADRHCPRCEARLRIRKPFSYNKTFALLAAAALLYLPANVYPIATIPIDLKPTSYTVLGGVVDLLKSHLIGLALLVFSASFTIPLLKMLGLAWCAFSAVRRSTRHLVGKTHVYRVIEEIGRWSMVDPLTIACFVPVLQFNSLIDGRAEAAATPFAGVVILTTFAVKCFDARLMWDAAGYKS